jgi:hypothetical protein
MVIKLTQENLPEYFSLPTADRTELLIGKNPYDFISRDSNRLIVTIGDSWTWGADLTNIKLKDLHHDKLSDDQYRLENVYGGVVAKHLNADFLNLGESGSGNYYIYNKLLELSNIANQLNYTNITVICVFTEVAREFDSTYDRSVDYFSWLNKNIKESKDYYKFLEFINQPIAEKIKSLTNTMNIHFATNFVDSIGMAELSKWFVKKTWLQVWCEHKKMQYPEFSYLVSPWIFEKLENIFTINPYLNKQIFFITLKIF